MSSAGRLLDLGAAEQGLVRHLGWVDTERAARSGRKENGVNEGEQRTNEYDIDQPSEFGGDPRGPLGQRTADDDRRALYRAAKYDEPIPPDTALRVQ